MSVEASSDSAAEPSSSFGPLRQIDAGLLSSAMPTLALPRAAWSVGRPRDRECDCGRFRLGFEIDGKCLELSRLSNGSCCRLVIWLGGMPNTDVKSVPDHLSKSDQQREQHKSTRA